LPERRYEPSTFALCPIRLDRLRYIAIESL
jgi:hypothetical protein